jgi:hypothetical protein
VASLKCFKQLTKTPTNCRLVKYSKQPSRQINPEKKLNPLEFNKACIQRGFIEIDREKNPGEPDCVKTTALGYAALKTGSKCSFTARKLRFFACFCLA